MPIDKFLGMHMPSMQPMFSQANWPYFDSGIKFLGENVSLHFNCNAKSLKLFNGQRYDQFANKKVPRVMSHVNS